MDIFINALIEVLFLAVYAGILGMVAPYVIGRNEDYGVVIPGAASLVGGLLIWVILVWCGMPVTNAFTWIIVMFLMPVIMWFAARRLAKMRDAENVQILADHIRGGHSADYLGS